MIFNIQIGNFVSYYYREEDDLGVIEGYDVLFDDVSDVEQYAVYYYRRGKNSIYHNEIKYFENNGISILN